MIQNQLNQIHIKVICADYLKCQQCKERFTNEKNLAIHESIHSKELACPVCKTQFIRFRNFKRHIEGHMEKDQFNCGICGEMFVSMPLLNKHMLAHRSRTKDSYKCMTCSKQFTTLKEYLMHKNLHKEIELLTKTNWKKKSALKSNNKCDFCQKHFSFKTSLTRHMLIHTGVQPFKCNICSKAFTQSSSLKDHMLIHSGIKPYSCRFCNKNFYQKGNMRSHIRNKHAPIATTKDNFSFICIQCGKILHTLDNLQRHYDTAHPKFYNNVLKDLSKDIERSLDSQISPTQSNIKCQIDVITPIDEKQEPTQILEYHNLNLNNQFICPTFDNNQSTDSNINLNSNIQIQNNTSIATMEAYVSNERSYQVINFNDINSLDSAVDKNNHDKVTFSLASSEYNETNFINRISEVDINYVNGCQGNYVIDDIGQGGVMDLEPNDSAVHKLNDNVDGNVMALVKSETFEYYVVDVDGIKIFQCPQCKRTCKLHYEMKAHLLTHNDSKPFNCHKCGKNFKTKKILSVHQMIHDEKKFVCNECGARFSLKNILTCHKRRHTGSKPFKCELCDKAFRTSGQRSYHKKSHFRTKTLKKVNITNSHPDNDHITFLNPIFKNADGELSNITPKNKDRDPNSSKNICIQCGSSFSKSSNLTAHMKRHLDADKQFKCSECNKCFVSNSNLKQHLNTHAIDKNCFQCMTCGDKYTTRGSLNRHCLKHKQLGDRYLCPYCGKPFKILYNCKRHILTHKKELLKSTTSSSQDIHPSAVTSTDENISLLTSHSIEINRDTIENTDLFNDKSLNDLNILNDVTIPAKLNDVLSEIIGYWVGSNGEMIYILNNLNNEDSTNGLAPFTNANVSYENPTNIIDGNLTNMNLLLENPASNMKSSIPIVNNATAIAKDNCIYAIERDSNKLYGYHGNEGDEFVNKAGLERLKDIDPSQLSVYSDFNLNQLGDALQFKMDLTGLEEEGGKRYLKIDCGDFLRNVDCGDLPIAVINRSNEVGDSDNKLEVLRSLVSTGVLELPNKDKDLTNLSTSNHKSSGGNKSEILSSEFDMNKKISNDLYTPTASYILNNFTTTTQLDSTAPILLFNSVTMDTGHTIILDMPTTEQTENNILDQLNESSGILAPIVDKYICDICQRNFKKMSHLKQHKLSHTGEKPFKCESCQKSFTTRSILKVHLISHLNIKDFKCMICGKVFVVKSQLDRHIRSHDNHICIDCNKNVPKNQRKKHIAAHQKYKNLLNISVGLLKEISENASKISSDVKSNSTKELLKCEVCSKLCKSSALLKRHMLSHSREKAYKCTSCDKSFSLKHHLVKHMELHRADRQRISCHLCSELFLSASSLKTHLKKHVSEMNRSVV